MSISQGEPPINTVRLFVYVIQSTPPEEAPVGIEIIERHVIPRLESLSLAVRTVSLTCKGELLKILNDAYFDYKENRIGFEPIIFHFDCHGSRDGLITANRDLATWDELRPYFQGLTELSNLNTVFIFGSCFGIYGLSTIRNTERASFGACFGPKREIDSIILHEFYRDFYRNMLDTGLLRNTIDAIMPNYKEHIAFYPAQLFFIKSYQKYLGNKQRIERSRKHIMKIIKKEQRFTQEYKKSVLRDVQRNFPHHAEFFERFKRTFFMLDLYPENEERFKDVTFEFIQSYLPYKQN